ncbi:glycoside hydrolase family 31 protein [Dinghuibacter silviterrae]|uniref:Alpha-D-xyloside xylohydrolase n=1 Tax=Dinghuibacter silviterrae TaxID=1539049 RepID=A0A4R8DFG7_9BACT|nr:TIM-barrel domain-containing protein [Dinghuibacter silviterrae]TDW95826.1 alpha-D-xyloside xylohydrolase [Dinghuibacter silviterrae]
MKTITLLTAFMLFAVGFTMAQDVEKTPSGVKAVVNDISVEIRFYSPSIVRVIKYPVGRVYARSSLSVIMEPRPVSFTMSTSGWRVLLQSDSIQVSLDTRTGRVAFASLSGASLLTEKDYGIQFSPTDSSFIVRQAFLLDKKEPIYGLGQQQNGRLNQRGQRIRLAQENMKICIPFFQSLKGYGLFWDNYSPTLFSDNPQETAFESEVGQGADYYFLYGAGGDGVVAQMRELTGQAPLMPLWVYGFLQSRERYKTQFELMEVVRRYRALQVPIDGIIQDWQYWGQDSNWNAMQFDPIRFPKPKLMVDSVHAYHTHLFVVAWPDFGPLTRQYSEFDAKHLLINFDSWPPNAGARPYDPYNPLARDLYWDYLNKGIFSLGVDAWWLDSSEPDHIDVKDSDFEQPTYLGSYRSVQNAFPLMHINGIYTHQRKTTSAKRVVILTRSAFAGQQRFGSCNWSGDVRSDWNVFRAQIPAGLNLSLTGIPYWNTDIGGFFAGRFAQDGGAKNPEFQELYTRWMQFAVFTPFMRSHGTDIPREIYQFGGPGQPIFDIQEKFIDLRYSLLPYIYSTAWQVTKNSGSFMRPLLSDFPSDTSVFNMDNEYMFGRSLLVSPVTEKGSSMQRVYLPSGANWIDFWTGEQFTGGRRIIKGTPMDILPVFVRAGSILPWGPEVQYATEKKWDDLEIRVYPGADATFTLYEDENDSYNYESGAYSEIDFQWNEASHTLTVGDRRGHFPGMPGERKFKVVIMGRGPGKEIPYNGKMKKVQL